MANIKINTNEIQELVLQVFGNKKISAITTNNTVLLTAIEQESVNQNTPVDKLCGMFKNTSLLSSDDFAKNKKYEKKIEEQKFNYE
jgi:hypothetical protein